MLAFKISHLGARHSSAHAMWETHAKRETSVVKILKAKREFSLDWKSPTLNRLVSSYVLTYANNKHHQSWTSHTVRKSKVHVININMFFSQTVYYINTKRNTLSFFHSTNCHHCWQIHSVQVQIQCTQCTILATEQDTNKYIVSAHVKLLIHPKNYMQIQLTWLCY